MIFSDLTVLLQISFASIILEMIKGSDLLTKKLDFKRTIKSCGIKKCKNFNNIQHNSLQNFILRQNKLKRSSKSVVSNVIGTQLILLIFTSYFSHDKWWPPLICFIY